MTPVLVAGVLDVAGGRCKKPGTLPLGPESTFMDKGLTMEDVAFAFGACERERYSSRRAGFQGAVGGEEDDKEVLGGDGIVGRVNV